MIFGKRAEDDAITDLAPQRARDERTGAEVYNDGREHIVYEVGGRRWRPYIERGRVAAVYLDRVPVWDDGTPLTAAELAEARDVLSRIYQHWKGELEFVAPDGERAVIVEDLSPQAVAHDSGAIVASSGRHSFVYARGGRTLSLAVEPLETYYLRLPVTPIWSDGTRLSQAEADQLVSDVQATFAHWGERCEFVPPGDPRILRTLDALVDYLRAEASQ